MFRKVLLATIAAMVCLVVAQGTVITPTYQGKNCDCWSFYDPAARLQIVFNADGFSDPGNDGFIKSLNKLYLNIGFVNVTAGKDDLGKTVPVIQRRMASIQGKRGEAEVVYQFASDPKVRVVTSASFRS